MEPALQRYPVSSHVTSAAQRNCSVEADYVKTNNKWNVWHHGRAPGNNRRGKCLNLYSPFFAIASYLRSVSDSSKKKSSDMIDWGLRDIIGYQVSLVRLIPELAVFEKKIDKSIDDEIWTSWVLSVRGYLRKKCLLRHIISKFSIDAYTACSESIFECLDKLRFP